MVLRGKFRKQLTARGLFVIIEGFAFFGGVVICPI
jgi:hypothetical protein